MTKPTPGPWRVYWATGKTHQIIGIGAVNGEGVADCGFGVWGGGGEEAVANARLIAAAPALLEALTLVWDKVLTEYHSEDSYVRQQVEAAIALTAAKQEGGE